MIVLGQYTRAAAAGLALFLATTSLGRAEDEHEKHHVPVTTETISQQSSPSTTQQPNDGMMGNMMGSGGGMMSNMMGGMSGATSAMSGACPMMMGTSDAEPRVEGRISFLKTELPITDAQEKAWEAYATAVRDNVESLKTLRHTMSNMMKSTSPVERLEMHTTVLENRLATLKKINPALANLYNALSEEQKQTANQILSPMSCMM